MRFPKILLLAAALAAAAYTLQGQIISIAPDGMEANVKHEEIKGFMAAMTMPYKVRDSKELASLKPGDLFTSTLVVVSNDAYIKDVKKVGEAPLENPAPSASSGFELLAPGQAVPNVVFTDQEGKRRDLESFRGSPVVLTFIYTTCPMPTFCPLMDRHFATIQEKTKGDPALSKVQLLSVSFDPTVDTPPVLKMHAQKLKADPARWTFATGDRDEIDQFAARFGVTIARDMKDPTNITHNLRTAIVDARGRLVKAYTGNEWTPDQVISDLKTMEVGG
jgi:protein SCO1